jgi:8-oxo-dGTP diphosphatase
VKRALLWLWKVLPLSHGVQWVLLWVMNRKFLVGVAAVAFDDAGRVLVVHHTYRNTYPWGLPGGWMHQGESPEQTAVRELREETGFEGRVERLLWVGSGRRPELEVAYVVRIVGGSFRACDEVDECRWLAPGEPLPEGMQPYQADVIALAQPSLAR